MMNEPRSGMYQTVYGNVVEYEEGVGTAFDIDACTPVPLEMVDFSKPIMEGE